MYLVLIAALIVACRSGPGPSTCSSHTECGATEACDFGIGGAPVLGQCAPTPCEIDANCTATYDFFPPNMGPFLKCVDAGDKKTCALQLCATDSDCAKFGGELGPLCDVTALPGVSVCIECKTDNDCTDPAKPACWIDTDDPFGMDNVCTECNEATACPNPETDYCGYDSRWDLDDEQKPDDVLPTFCDTQCDSLQAVENITCNSTGADACGMATYRIYDEADCKCESANGGCVVRECTDDDGCSAYGTENGFNNYVCDKTEDFDWYCRNSTCADFITEDKTDYCFVTNGAPSVCDVSDDDNEPSKCEDKRCVNNLGCTGIYPFCNTKFGVCMEATTAQAAFTDENEYCSREYADTSYVAKDGECGQVFCTDNNGCASYPGYICDVGKKRCDIGCDGNQTVCALQSTWEHGVLCQSSGVCAFTTCTTSADCVTAGFVCGPDGDCVQGCTPDPNGDCVLGCNSDTDCIKKCGDDYCANMHYGLSPRTLDPNQPGYGPDYSMRCGAGGLCAQDPVDCSQVSECTATDIRLTCAAGFCAVACLADDNNAGCQAWAMAKRDRYGGVREEDIQYYVCTSGVCEFTPPVCSNNDDCIAAFGGAGSGGDNYKCDTDVTPALCYYSDNCEDKYDCWGGDGPSYGLGATCDTNTGVCSRNGCKNDGCGAQSVEYAEAVMRDDEIYPYQMMCNERDMCDPNAYPILCKVTTDCDDGNGFVCSTIRVPSEPYFAAADHAFEGYYGVCVQECEDTLFSTGDEQCNVVLGSFGLTNSFACNTGTGQCQFSNEATCSNDASCDGIEDTCLNSPFNQRICYKSCATNTDCATAYATMYSNAALITCKDILPTPRGGGRFCDTFTVMNDLTATTTTTTVVVTTKTPNIAGKTTETPVGAANTYGVIAAVAITAFITQWMV